MAGIPLHTRVSCGHIPNKSGVSSLGGGWIRPPSVHRAGAEFYTDPHPPLSESFVHIAGCFLRDSFPEGGLQLQGAETRPRLSTWIAKLLSNLHSCQRTRILVQNALLMSQQSHFTHRGGHGALKSQARVFQAPLFPAVAASPENLLEMQLLRPHSRSAELVAMGAQKPVFSQTSQLILIDSKFESLCLTVQKHKVGHLGNTRNY